MIISIALQKIVRNLTTLCTRNIHFINLFTNGLVLIYDSFFTTFVVKEHYMGNKVRNAQVREDAPRAKVEQELEALRYQNYIQQQ